MDSTPQLPGIRDEDLTNSAPAVRALIVKRLEQMWATVQPHVDGTRAEEGWSPDVRFLEAGIRIVDRLALIYRLREPVPPAPGALEASQDSREVALKALEAAEAKERGL